MSAAPPHHSVIHASNFVEDAPGTDDMPSNGGTSAPVDNVDSKPPAARARANGDAGGSKDSKKSQPQVSV
jgi:hypothetical protein